ncbi:type 2 lanthipeptide synthetase LanM [Enterococcus quebecensis]|uniref:Lantibiotic biosynthesis protein n=1 Tax=Enterococcus quebecensis TaxID=903983 RepID=A0A1E5GWB1_9ENTE|nr:type 2 lanthipeptide synthetase LanM [Enterococcus quebecensis]OEG16994.1 lantibiotic biosynthesis protein [Enterococcus quebecensis]OJG75362.1 type 2 lantibiotic biosynthesis protein LanM [Enterococcus quebecensis]
MSEELTYTYATTISERIQDWKDLSIEEDEQLYLKQWQSRKSLLKAADYDKMFQYYQLNEHTFSRGLLPFTEERAQLLLPTIEKSDWFQLHKYLFEAEIPIKELGLKAALRFHANYYENHIRSMLLKFPLIQLSEKVIEELVEQLRDDFFFLAQKTLVWDVHQMIEEYQLQAESKEEEFTKYIEEFLGDKQRTYLFYGEYPTLAKLLAVRLMFACKTMEEFIASLSDSIEQLAETFDVSIPMDITEIELGQGDSHERGKTVIQFQIEGIALIFKFKNLAIGTGFNELLTYLEELNPTLSFYKIKRIIQPTFTIEEKVTYGECKNETEVMSFYKNYGQLLAIVYWLGATDLHMENLIAHGSHPVLIDVETLIRPEMFILSKKLSKQTRIEKHSVIVSGLLPQKKKWKRELEMDALSGTKQKLPKKIRKLRNDGSSDIAFQLEEAYLDGAQNIPRLNGKEVDYQLYSHVIQNGFKEMNQLLLNNKTKFIQKFKELFADTTIRLIYRDTQDYGNLLHYTLHTECMSNYIEREKIIENLWASKIIPKELIPFEVQAMQDHDVPLFTANTSSTNVYTNGQEIPKLLKKTPLQDTVAHMEQITETTSNFSYLLLKESLGTLEYGEQDVIIPARNRSVEQPLLQKAADIGDKIIDQLDLNQESGEVDWLSVLPESDGELGITYPDTDLYNGSGGVYLFFVYLNDFVPKDSYQKVINLLEKELFLTENETNIHDSAFFGEGMRLTVAFYVTNLLRDDKHRLYMERSLNALKNAPKEKENQLDEWLYGKASLLSVLAAIYQTFHSKEAYELLLYYVQLIRCEEMEDNSFAHGYAGVLYGLSKANQILKKVEVGKKIDWYQKKFEKKLETEEIANASWCRGAFGIQEVCKLINLSMPVEKVKKGMSRELADSCLCHGQYGSSDNYLNNIDLLKEEVVTLKSDPENSPISLFCGLSGVGYQLLRAYDSFGVRSLLFIN